MSITETLPENQQDLIKKYLRSNIFKGCCTDVNAATKALTSANNINKNCGEGAFICIYGGLFGLGSKIKTVTFFSEDTFYFRLADVSQAVIIPYAKIQKVNYNNGDKSGEVLYDNFKRLTLPKKIIVALKGIEIIRKMSSNSSNLLGEYIISQEEKIFGEYLTFSMLGLFKHSFPKGNILDWIPCRCTITEVSLDKVEIKITVTDKDYDYFSPEEWEIAINTFSTRKDILDKIREELSIRLYWDYSLEQIVFSSRFRKSVSKAISNGVNTVSGVASTVREQLETSAYYEAAQNSRLKASIIKESKGTDNDDYVESMEQYKQYTEAYQERTKVSNNDDDEDDSYYYD